MSSFEALGSLLATSTARSNFSLRDIVGHALMLSADRDANRALFHVGSRHADHVGLAQMPRRTGTGWRGVSSRRFSLRTLRPARARPLVRADGGSVLRSRTGSRDPARDRDTPERRLPRASPDRASSRKPLPIGAPAIGPVTTTTDPALARPRPRPRPCDTRRAARTAASAAPPPPPPSPSRPRRARTAPPPLRPRADAPR